METVRYKPNFQGSFRSWYVVLTTNREKGLSDRFVVFSSGKRRSVHKYLWHKLLWDELSKVEFLLFISMPETLSNMKMLGFLRCRLILNKKVLRQRVNKMEQILGEKVTSRSSYQGLKRLKIEIQMEEIKLPKVTKFSGYVKNISSIGRNSGGPRYIPEPISEEFVEERESFDWYELLSVGEFSLLSQEILLPEEDQKSETEIITVLT